MRLAPATRRPDAAAIRALLAATALATAACTAEPIGSGPLAPRSSGSAAASSAPAEAFLRLVGDGPVLVPSELGAYGWALPGAFTFTDGAYHAWVVGFGAERGDQRVVHVTSPDARSWTVQPTQLEAELAVAFSPPGPIPTSVVELGEGRWAMYLWGTPAPETDRSSIWVATASSVDGPWTLATEPALAHGGIDDWDGRGLDFASVVRTDDGYLMLVSGANFAARAVASIGAATSEDGLVWEKRSEPVIPPGFCGAFDSLNASQSRLLADSDGGYLLAYGGYDGAENGMRMGLATSSDGLSWECRTSEPLLGADDIAGSTGIHTIATALGGDGDPLVLIEALMDDRSELWLATLAPPAD
jgi:hypothetical protein